MCILLPRHGMRVIQIQIPYHFSKSLYSKTLNLKYSISNQLTLGRRCGFNEAIVHKNSICSMYSSNEISLRTQENVNYVPFRSLAVHDSYVVFYFLCALRPSMNSALIRKYIMVN